MSEKTEKATAQKLKKAKEKGQVNKSAEMITSLSLLCALGVLAVSWPQELASLKKLVRDLFYFAGHFHFSIDSFSYLLHELGMALLSLWFPVIGVIIISIILATLAQTGMTWSTSALTPDFKRFNLSENLKKLFSISKVYEAFKCLLKISCSLMVLFFIFKNHLISLIEQTLFQINTPDSLFLSFLLKSSLQLIILLIFLSFIDKKITHWQFSKQQRMSKQDVKEEYRQKEGDPKIKSKIRQLQSQLRQKTAALKQIKTADIVITNPTHIAIALKYNRYEMPAPKVIYKAQNKHVSQVKTLAKKYGIPVIEHKLLARMLHFSTDLNQYISKELFPLTAEVFRDLYRQEEK